LQGAGQDEAAGVLSGRPSRVRSDPCGRRRGRPERPTSG
jgi:hypothetical protein